MIDIAIADAREARHYGRIARDAGAVDKVVRRLRSAHRRMTVVYEAGPCGFWLYRRLTAQGIACMVVSPSISLIDRRHFDDAALPIRTPIAVQLCVYVNAEAVARPLTALSHINVHAHRRARWGG